MSAESSGQEEGKPQASANKSDGFTNHLDPPSPYSAESGFHAAATLVLESEVGARADRRPCLPAELGEVYESSRPFLEWVAKRCGVPDVDVDDCLHDAWVVIVRECARDRFDPTLGSLTYWVSLIAKRKIRKWARCRSRCRTEQLPDDRGQPWGEHDSAASVFFRAELQADVQRVFKLVEQRVGPDPYEVFHMHGVEGKSVAHVALALGMAAENVSCVHRRVQRVFFEIFKGNCGSPFE
jgi:RNA polymerase sigma factor (sigma-70 family)